jgi:RND family efflux transporter MFP subunit
MRLSSRTGYFLKEKQMRMNGKYLIIVVLFSTVLWGCQQFRKKQEVKDPEFMGYIENTQVNVTTRIPGRITDIFVDEGDSVREGDKIAQLDTRPLLTKLSALETKLANVAVNKKRVENLYKAGAIPRKKLDDIETAYSMLRDNIKELKINIEDMTIRAPMDGIVTVRVLEVNQMMPPGMPVVIETDPEGTWARFNVPESYLDQISPGKKFSLRTNVPRLTFTGKVIQVIPMADFATFTPTELRGERDVRTFDVKMKIVENEMECKPGMSVYLTLKPLMQQQEN